MCTISFLCAHLSNFSNLAPYTNLNNIPRTHSSLKHPSSLKPNESNNTMSGPELNTLLEMKNSTSDERFSQNNAYNPTMNKNPSKDQMLQMMDNPMMEQFFKNPELMLGMMPDGGEKEQFKKMLENPMMKSMMRNPSLLKSMMSMA